MYGVAWAEFSTRHASGWPDGQDNYDPATPAPPFAEYTVLQSRPDLDLTSRRCPIGPAGRTAQGFRRKSDLMVYESRGAGR